MTNNHEIYYNDGGHSGPYRGFASAHQAAVRYLKGSEHTTRIEIRSYNSPVLGGYSDNIAGSFYVSKGKDGFTLSAGIQIS